MPHDYDFQDDAHLANTALNDAEIDLHLDPVQYYETFEIRIGHFFLDAFCRCYNWLCGRWFLGQKGDFVMHPLTSGLQDLMFWLFQAMWMTAFALGFFVGKKMYRGHE